MSNNIALFWPLFRMKWCSFAVFRNSEGLCTKQPFGLVLYTHGFQWVFETFWFLLESSSFRSTIDAFSLSYRCFHYLKIVTEKRLQRFRSWFLPRFTPIFLFTFESPFHRKLLCIPVYASKIKWAVDSNE